MALYFGELAGTLGLDTRPFDKGLESAGKNIRGFAKTGAVLGAAAGVAVGAAIVGGILKSMDVGRANDKLAAQLGLNAKESEQAGKVAGSLYANAYGESLEEVNTAVGGVMSSIKGMRTASAEDVEAMTAKVLDLSAAFELDAGRSAQVLGQMITSGLGKDGVEAADLLTASLQKVPAAVREDILDAVDEYGPFMSNLGISGEKAMGMLVKASENGMYGIDKTGDALKEFEIRATDMSKASGEAYETLGLNQTDMTNALLAGGETAGDAFQTIVGGLEGIEDPSARSAAALALFGTPLEDMSVTEIPAFLASLSDAEGGLGDVAGAADAMGDTLNDNAATNLESFKRQISTTFVDFIGGKALPAIEDLATFLATNVGPILDEITGGINAFGAAWMYNDGDITSSGFPGFMEQVGYQARQAYDALLEVGQWMVDNQSTIQTIATVVAVLLLPTLIRLGVTALVSGAQQVTAWTMTQAGAIKSGVVYVAQSFIIIGRWVAMGAAAVVSGAQTAAIWMLYRVEAIKGAVAYGVQGARVAAAWVVMSAAAAASGAKTAAVWTGTIIANAVKGAVSFTIQAGRVVGGWVLMGAQSLLHAGRMAAAWLIAMGPVGWVIAGVIGLVAIIIANWDKISSVTRALWEDKVKPIFQRLASFITEDVPDAFKNGVAAIKIAWNKIQEIAKVPVRFVVNTVINDGLIGTFNKIPGVNLPDVKLPPGFAKGGLASGWAMVGEEGPELVNFTNPGRVYTAKQSARMLGEAGSAANVVRHDGGGVPGAFMGNRNAIARHAAYHLSVAPGMEAWNFAGAARMWDGAAGVKVRTGRGQHQGYVSPLERGGGILGYTTGTNIDMSPSWMARLGATQRRTVSAHEIGHALGLPHTNAHSIMAPGLGQMASTPTAWDIRNLQALYPGGTGKAGSAVPENPFNGLVKSLIAGIKEAFPGGGMFIDAGIGLVQSGIEQVLKFVTDIKDGIKNIAGNVVGAIGDFFGGGAAMAPMTVMDGGGWLKDTDGPTVIHQKRKPDAFTPFDEWKQVVAHAGGTGPGLSDEDRKLFQDLAKRPVIVKVGAKTIAEANIDGRRELRLPK